MVLLRDYLEILEPLEYIKIFKNKRCIYDGYLSKGYLAKKDEILDDWLICKVISHETFLDVDEDNMQIGLRIEISEVE